MWLFFFNYSSVKNNESVGAYPVPGAGSCHVAHTGVWAHGAGMLCVCVRGLCTYMCAWAFREVGDEICR